MSIQLARHARVLRCAALAAGGFYIAATVAALASLGGWGGRFVAATLQAGDMPLSWAAGTAVAIALLLGAAMFELARMLARVGRERVFPPDATRHFRRFALFFLLATLVRAVMPALAMGVQSVRDGSGALRMTFDGGDAVTLLVAALLWLVARLFDEAARLEDDSRSIV